MWFLRNLRFQIAQAVLVCILLALPAAGQLQVGDNVKLNLNGNVGFGYGGEYDNLGPSNHNISANGDATLQGSYFDPRFLSFSIQPFYGRSQNNSASQSILDSTGVNLTSSIFSGSHFPGNFSYNRTSNSNGQFGIAGQNSVISHGDSQGFGIGWSAIFPGLPTLSANFSNSASTSSLFGSNQTTDSSNRTFNLRSNYTLDGFRLDGTYTKQWTNTSYPMFLSGMVQESASRSEGIGVSSSHRLPWSGNWMVQYNRQNYSYDFFSGATGGVTNTLTSNVLLNPWSRVNFSGGLTYTSNLFGALNQQLLSQGALAPAGNSASHGVMLYGGTGITVNRYLSLQANVNHAAQFFFGKTYSSTQFGGTASFNFSRPLFGALNFSVGAVDSATQAGNQGTGLVANVSYSHKFGRWETNSDFGYSQNVQTLIVIYTTSSFNYGGSVRRRLGERIWWSSSFRAMHSALTRQQGDGSRSESMSTNLLWRSYGLVGTYSQSRGSSVLTPNGLVATPLPGVVPLLSPLDVVVYNGQAFSISANASPLPRFTVVGSYSQARSDTLAQTLASNNRTKMLNATLRWNLRKVLFTAGFTRFNQAFSALGTPGSVVNSYYFGVSRWFNFF